MLTEKCANNDNDDRDSFIIFWGGTIAPDHVCVDDLYGTTEIEDVVKYVYTNYSQYYGDDLEVCLFKCECSRELRSVLHNAHMHKFVDGTNFIYASNATDCIDIVSEVVDHGDIIKFKLMDYIEECSCSGECSEECIWEFYKFYSFEGHLSQECSCESFYA